MTAIDLQTTLDSSVTNPELVLVDMKRHLEQKRHEGAIVQSLKSPEKPKKRKGLHSTNKTSPKLERAQTKNFQNLYKMMLAILAMESVLSNNLGKRQVLQTKIGQAFIQQTINNEKKVEHEIYEANHRPWWEKAFSWAFAIAGVLMAALTFGAGAAAAMVFMTAMTMSGAMNKGFLGKLNHTLLGKIAIVGLMSLACGGISAGVDGLAGAESSSIASSAKFSAFMGGVAAAANNNLLGAILYETFTRLGESKKSARKWTSIAGMLLLILSTIAAGKNFLPESKAGISGQALNKFRSAITAAVVITSIGEGISEIMSGVTNFKLAEKQEKYARALSNFILFKELTEMNTEKQKEESGEIQRQSSVFEQENQTFSVFTLPTRTLARVLA